MTDTIQLIWQLTAPDGPRPWEDGGRWQTDFSRLHQIALTVDRLGFHGILLEGGAEVLALAAALVPATDRLRFLIALTDDALPAESLTAWAAGFERITAGRLTLVNAADTARTRRLQVIARETDEDAWTEADRLFKRLPAARLAQAGSAAHARDLETTPGIWSAPALFWPDDTAKRSTLGLVGSGETLARRIQEFADQGTNRLILSAWPQIAEAHRIADHLLPLLSPAGGNATTLRPERAKVGFAPPPESRAGVKERLSV